MKTYLRNYEITRGDVMAACEAWLSGESGRKNAHRVGEEHGDAASLVGEIYDEVRGRSLAFRPIRRYSMREPTNGKVRTIGISSVKQQVCDYLVCGLLQPLFDAKLGFYQVAAVRGKGQRLCRGALRRWVRDARYHVKLDVRQCYPSTSHEVVRRIYGTYVGSADVLYVIDALLATYGRGLEIGSYFSMQTMQLVLSFAYHHVEGLHKVRRGMQRPLVTHQMWHMDDALLVSRDKRDLKAAARSVEGYLRNELGLSVKPWKVARTGDVEPLDLGGWVVRPGSCVLRPGTFLRARRSFARFRRHPGATNARRCCSYWGWVLHADCEGFRRRDGTDLTFAHARAVVSRHDRLEHGHGKNTVRHAA